MSTTFTVPYGAFKRIAKLALRCVGTDPLLPVFTFVEFRASGGVLMATATDRYTVARARVEVEDLPDATFYLASRAVRLILATFKAPARELPALTFTVSGDATVVSGRLANRGSDVTLTFGGMEGAWPKLDHFFVLPADPEPVEHPILAANFLRRIPPGQGHGDSVTMTRKGQVHGFYSEWWAIIIMAQREPSDGSNVLGGWAA